MANIMLGSKPYISPKKEVKIIKSGNIIESIYVDKKSNNLSNIKKLNSKEYMKINTGEILKYKKSEKRLDNVSSLKNTFKKMRRIINANFQGGDNELFITLTYKENVTDVKRIYKDFNNFRRKLARRYNGIEYFACVEPQERGAWHFHILLKKSDIPVLYIPNDEIRELWGQGIIVYTQRLKNVDNVGAYLTSYLTNIEVNGETGTSKKYVKGGRLHLYPPGMRIFRHSKTLKQPIEEKIKYEELKKIVGSRPPNYSKTLIVQDDFDRYLNTVYYEQYNLFGAASQT